MGEISAHPRFSVIIPTYKRPDLLKLCLEKLAPDAQTFAGDYEVIVSDDDPAGSARTSLEQSFPWVRWVQGPGKGPAANRNAGAAEAHGEWLAFTDDDCLPEPGWLAGYASAIQQNQKAEVLEGLTFSGDEPMRLLEFAPDNHTGGFLWSCNFAIGNKVFYALEGFDEAFPYAHMEDVDFRERLMQANYKLHFVDNACVFHPRRLEVPSWKKSRTIESEFYYAEKHGYFISFSECLRAKLGYFYKRWKNPGTFSEHLKYLCGVTAELGGMAIRYVVLRGEYKAGDKKS